MSARYFLASIEALPDAAKAAVLIIAVVAAGAAANLAGALAIVGGWQ